MRLAAPVPDYWQTDWRRGTEALHIHIELIGDSEPVLQPGSSGRQAE